MNVNQCHWNVAHLFEHKVIDQIIIGYALSINEIWFQHTWGIRENILIETSKVNFLGIKTYFGVEIKNPNEFVLICKENPVGSGKIRRRRIK